LNKPTAHNHQTKRKLYSALRSGARARVSLLLGRIRRQSAAPPVGVAMQLRRRCEQNPALPGPAGPHPARLGRNTSGPARPSPARLDHWDAAAAPAAAAKGVGGRRGWRGREERGEVGRVGGWGGDVAKSGRRAESTASVVEAGSNSAAATQRSEGVFRAYACEEACLAGDLPSRGLPGDFSTLFARGPAFGDAAAAAAASRRLSGDLSAPCDCWLA